MSGALARARSLLFLPADRLERLPKALASGAHAVILDLEDAVADAAIAEARAALLRAMRALPADTRARLLVRINAAGAPRHEEDLLLLRQLAGLRLGAVMLPKCEEAASVERAARLAAVPVVPLIESARGVHAIDLIAGAHGVLRLAFGHLDFQLDLGMQCGPDERELDGVRLQIVMASRRAGLPAPSDGVTVALDDDALLAADSQRSRRLGFGAKLCIHPRQVEAVNHGFMPGAAELAWARRVLDAAASAGGAAIALDGKMIDRPVLLRAQAVLDQARR
jgi:citrate lyase subunit beta/citryl-CoA lyase